jgi:hypothetical protein
MAKEILLLHISKAAEPMCISQDIIMAVFNSIISALGSELVTSDWLYSHGAKDQISEQIAEELRKAALRDLQRNLQELPRTSINRTDAPPYEIIQQFHTHLTDLALSFFPDPSHVSAIVEIVMEQLEVTDIRSIDTGTLPDRIQQASQAIQDGALPPDTPKHSSLYEVSDEILNHITSQIAEVIDTINHPGIDPRNLASHFVGFYSSSMGELDGLLDFPDWENLTLAPAIQATLQSGLDTPPPALFDRTNTDQPVSSVDHLWPTAKWRTIE